MRSMSVMSTRPTTLPLTAQLVRRLLPSFATPLRSRLIIDLQSTNLMVIALGADVFFWVAGEIDCSCSLGAAGFRLFGNTDIDIAAGGAIGVECVEKADPLVCSRSNDTGELLFFQPLLWRPFLGECRRRKKSECQYRKQEIFHFDRRDIPRSTHFYVEMIFPSESAGVDNEQVKLIVAGVFLRRLVIDLRALNLVLIALRADIFFWIMD